MSLEKKFMKQTKYTQKPKKVRKLAPLMTEEQKQLFEQLANTRSHEHTGGRRKKSNSGKTEERGLFD